jgi:hypothetical protein
MVPHTNDSRQECSESVSRRVVEAVADARDIDVLELTPLYDVVDPDALNQLFDYDTASNPVPASVHFSMEGCDVVVHRDGSVDASVNEGGASQIRETDATGVALD